MAALPTAADLTTLVAPRLQIEPVRAAAELELIAALAKGYTRGNGFYDDGTVEADLRAVILSATARFHHNPSQIRHSVTKGPQSASFDSWNGWSLSELFVLNRYRVRAR